VTEILEHLTADVMDVLRVHPEAIAEELDRNPDYRVLRRFQPNEDRRYMDPVVMRELHKGVYLDFETTGLDPLHDRPIELAMARFAYDAHGLVAWVGGTYQAFEHPGVAIPPEITELTGITDSDVMGQAFNEDDVHRMLDGVSLVVAHNADFDRKVAEARFPALAFKRLPWACSYRGIDWARHKVRNAQLGTLLIETRGEFYEPHRAMDDVLVGVHVLAGSPDGASTYLAELLANALTPTTRLLAWGSPFAQKDELKRRGYRWEATKKVWYRDMVLGSPAATEEHAWLSKVCPGASSITFTAVDRYSVRV